jgi:hypothetical protein
MKFNNNDSNVYRDYYYNMEREEDICPDFCRHCFNYYEINFSMRYYHEVMCNVVGCKTNTTHKTEDHICDKCDKPVMKLRSKL